MVSDNQIDISGDTIGGSVVTPARGDGFVVGVSPVSVGRILDRSVVTPNRDFDYPATSSSARTTIPRRVAVDTPATVGLGRPVNTDPLSVALQRALAFQNAGRLTAIKPSTGAVQPAASQQKADSGMNVKMFLMVAAVAVAAWFAYTKIFKGK